MTNKLFKLILLILIATAPAHLFAAGGAPTINSVTVGNLTGTTAPITATVWPNGNSTAISIQYSLLNNNFGSGTQTISMGGLNQAASATPVTITLTGLALSTKYYFRI